ncbi:hypothetical protein TNCV_3573051 [Trichonephila clavipes]|nr:hypothetical protein TNCV_3573051 [Trichonephila clavipes]
MLTATPLGLGSNPGEDMDVCKCIGTSRHGDTLNSRRAASPLVRTKKSSPLLADGLAKLIGSSAIGNYLFPGERFFDLFPD